MLLIILIIWYNIPIWGIPHIEIRIIIKTIVNKNGCPVKSFLYVDADKSMCN
jgi:hypothetical protein